MVFRSISSLVLMFCCFSAFAIDQSLVEVKVEGEDRRLDLVVSVDEKSDLKELKIIEIINEKVASEDVYNIENDTNEIVIMKQSGREVVKLVSTNFSNYQGGIVFLDYLYNGITGRRSRVEFNVARDGDVWSMFSDSVKVKKLFVTKNRKRFVGVIGIRNIMIK